MDNGKLEWKIAKNENFLRLIVDNADKFFFRVIIHILTFVIFYTPHFLHSAFFTLRLFCTPHFLLSVFSTLRTFHTPHFLHSELRPPRSAYSTGQLQTVLLIHGCLKQIAW